MPIYKVNLDIPQRSTSCILTYPLNYRFSKTIQFFFTVQLISTNKVLFRVNILYEALETISKLCPTIVYLKFNQCKLHVTNYHWNNGCGSLLCLAGWMAPWSYSVLFSAFKNKPQTKFCIIVSRLFKQHMVQYI